MIEKKSKIEWELCVRSIHYIKNKPTEVSVGLHILKQGGDNYGKSNSLYSR